MPTYLHKMSPTATVAAMAMILIISSGCMSSTYRARTSGASQEFSERDLDLPQHRIFPDGALVSEGGVEKKQASSGSSRSRYEIETGEINGVRYRTFKNNGTGAVQGLRENTLEIGIDGDRTGTNWSTRTRVDLVNDTHRAMLDRGAVRITRTSQGQTFVWVGGDHFPRSEMTIRIDDNAPISAREDRGFTPAQVEEILSQLRTGSTVTTRYMKWPYRRYRDEQWSTFGFNEALEVVDWLVENLDRERYAEVNRDRR